MAYGLKYELNCKTKYTSQLYVAKVYFDGYNGSQIDRNLPLSPFVLRKDKAAVIRGTSFEFAMREAVDFEFLEFYSNSSKTVKIELYDPAENLIWTGYNLPQQYQVPYVPSPATVSFTATDGLGLLKTESFGLTGFTDEFTMLRYCIDKIQLALKYSISISMYHVTGMVTNRSPLEQTFYNAEIYAGNNCYQVIEKLLQKYDAEITQSGGRWLILSSADKGSSRFGYSASGEYEEVISAPAVKYLNYPGLGEIFPSPSLSMSLEPGAKQVTLHHDYGRRNSLLVNPDFEKFDSGVFTGWTNNIGSVDPQQVYGSSGLMALLPGFDNAAGHYISQQIEYETSDGDELYISYKYGSQANELNGPDLEDNLRKVRLMISVSDGVSTYWLYLANDVAVWSDTEQYIEHTILPTLGGIPTLTEVIINATRPPVDGTLEVVLYYCQETSSWTGFVGNYFADAYVRFLNNSFEYPSEITLTAVFDNSVETSTLEQIEIPVAGAPLVSNASLLYNNVERASDGSLLEDSVAHERLNKLAMFLASRCRLSRQKLSGRIKGAIAGFEMIIEHSYNSERRFEIAEGTWDIFEECIDAVLLEVLPWSIEDITYSTVVGTADTGSSGGSSSGGSGAGSPLPSWLESIFQLVNGGTADAYLRCKLPFAGDYNIEAFADFAGFPGSWWNNMPVASETVLGGVKIDGTTITIDENGVISASVSPGGDSLWEIFDSNYVIPSDGRQLLAGGNLQILGNAIEPYDNGGLLLKAGNAVEANDSGGYLYLSAGNAIYGDETTTAGKIVITPARDSQNIMNGEIYFGDLNAGGLKPKTTETNIIFYDTETGKISYGAAGSGAATSLETDNFSILEEAGALTIKYGTTVIATISSTGFVQAAGNIEANSDL